MSCDCGYPFLPHRDGCEGKVALSSSRSTALLAGMTEDELRFSYTVLLAYEAHRQLGREMDGNLQTCMVAIQEDIEAVKAEMLKPANAGSHRQEEG